MSAFSDWKCGAMSDWEFEQWGIQFNAEERYYAEHEFDEPYDEDEDYE